CLGRNHDAGFIAEVVHERRSKISGLRAGNPVGTPMSREPLLIDLARFCVSVGAVEENDSPLVRTCLKDRTNVLLRAGGFGKDDCLFASALTLGLRKPTAECRQ